jgi:oligopeptide/dipeptide ABC transporter ATP-binding protein
MGLHDGNAIVSAKELRLATTNLLQVPENQMRGIRGERIAMVFQDPMRSLNPVYTVGVQIKQVIRAHSKCDRKEARERARTLLETVGIPDASGCLDRYPHEISGGMQQRVMIAMALSGNPELLIADEPTTALDGTIQAQILELLLEMRDRFGMSMLFISHDLAVVAGVADRVAVMYAGAIVEIGDVASVLTSPKHPYTQALLRAAPSLSGPIDLEAIPGVPVQLGQRTRGCTFAPRCIRAEEKCREDVPILEQLGLDQHVACWVANREGGK